MQTWLCTSSKVSAISVSLSTADAYAAVNRAAPTRGRGRIPYDHDPVHPSPNAGRLRRVAPVRDGAAATPPVSPAGAGERLRVHGTTGSRPPGSTGEEAGPPRRRGRLAVTGTHREPDAADDLGTSITNPGHLAGH
ncbi:hypothetical protein [Streptomyces sp. NPDC026673]|uniref:hypothetical protein n=1 Tax=Streptomyces sp. NPDC026673 TaxID=3155724 RepID=UPI0033DEC358